MALEDYSQFIYRCSKCGACRFSKKKGEHGPYNSTCPSGVRFGFESYWPSGKNDIARGLLEGTLEWSGRLIHRVYSCTTCGACDQICREATGKRTFPVIMELRRELVRRNIGPVPVLKQARKNIEKFHNPQKMEHEKRLDWLPEDVNSKGKIIFYAGCTASYMRQEIARSVVKVLKSADIEFGVLEDEWCCGYPDFYAGYEDSLKETARHNVEVLEKAGAEKVLFACPGCYDVFKNHYPEFLDRELPFETAHTTEYFNELIKGGVLKPAKEIEKRVTYHDPCKLGRMNGVYDDPREIMRNIPGLDLVEMERDREFSWCCGGGGNIPLIYPDFARWTAGNRLEEAESTEVDMLVSACPGCKNSLKDAGGNMEVVDLTELLARSI